MAKASNEFAAQNEIDVEKPEKVIPSLCEGFVLGRRRSSYGFTNCILYALGVGASQDPLDATDLQYTYENHENFTPLPTFGCVIPEMQLTFDGLQRCPGLPDFNPMMLLHGEHKLILPAPLPVNEEVEAVAKIKNVFDKKSGALVIIQTDVYSIATGSLICVNEASLFIRGIGGFGGLSGSKQKKPIQIPARPPDHIFTKKTVPNQALIYRLCGDYNPLHVDPEMAALGGFNSPILHGLCFFGIAGLGVVRTACRGDANSIKSIEARFSNAVIPGQTLKVEIWEESGDCLFRVINMDTQKECVSNGLATLRNSSASKL
uniref:Hydroxysteroid 17-beta dehydrogenase 4 n=1 Tax=Nephromyces sp. MMRI TaxID=2496275 RepID=A0A3Q8UBM8_9APIC|nr:hydroxysteroid 17-beta dehydrogenase 4 [Nephromyces sp. MMRI]